MSMTGPIESLEIDDDGYPSELVLDSIRALKDAPPEAWRLFMAEQFVPLASQLSYARCDTSIVVDGFSKRKMLRIEFATGGWSGCEDFIEAVLSVPIMSMMYYAEWRRGGLHVFEVPIARPGRSVGDEED